MKNWNNVDDEELEGLSDMEEGFSLALEELHRAKQMMTNSAEIKRIKAGNAIMNYITEKLLETQKVYRDDFGHNYIEAMRADSVWVFESDEEFNKLMREYFELTVGD